MSTVLRCWELSLAEWAFRNVSTSMWTTRPLFGATMHLNLARSRAQQLLYLMGRRFIGEFMLLERLVHPGMRVVDVGANIGYYLLLFERLVGAFGKVICIEPSPENVAELSSVGRELRHRPIFLRFRKTGTIGDL
jgi:hypothetical protein